MLWKLIIVLLVISLGLRTSNGRETKNLAWNGGPVNLQCEFGPDSWTNGYVKENVIAVKALQFQDAIYVITPRSFGKYFDHRTAPGKLWILDTGVIDTLTNPKCTCPPKIVIINLLFGKLTKRIDISSSLLEANSLLQNIVVEYDLGGNAFIYASDASRGAIVVHELSSGAVFGEHSKPVVLLGADGYHIYLRHFECSDVLVWNTRDPYNSSRLDNIHSAGPQLTTTSVAADPFKPMLLILDSDYLTTLRGNSPTYHKITFVNKKIH
ncbi:hypothetical protein HF086_004120 [Spodoptera exigua]|uniref:Bee-milk protein n=1 Tax=Spodoptera exigua TaxID=7107 RepID=A0A922SD65_SPOEX|nr:hypothetical protein HF086_004120 [Spodoptera exigua]